MPPPSRFRPYAIAALGMAALTLAFLPLHDLLRAKPGSIAFVQFMLLLFIASRLGSGPALAAAILGVAAWGGLYLGLDLFSRPGLEDGVLFAAYAVAALYAVANGKRRAEIAEEGRQEIARLYAELRENETRYRGLIESAWDALVIVDGDGRIRLLNTRAEALFGYARRELEGQAVEILVPEALRELHRQHRRNYLAAPHSRTMGEGVDLFGRRKDGSCFQADISLSPLRVGGELLVNACIRDISERKAAEEKLRQAMAELQQVIASVSDCLWSAETDGRGEWSYRYYSPVVERITGRPAEFFLAGPERWLSIVHADERERVNAAFRRIAGGGSAQEEEEYRIVLPDGGSRWVRDSLTASRLAPGRLRIDGVVSEIGARKRVEAERQARLAAEAANHAKSNFLANMSHELRSPLTTILGFAELLVRDPALPAPFREDLERIMKSGECLQALVDQVLDLSRLESGGGRLAKTDFDLQLLLDDLRNLFMPRMVGKGLQLLLEPLPRRPRHVRTDPIKLRQVLSSLLENALEFAAAGRVALRVEAAPLAGDIGEWQLRFVVADSGPGIAPGELAGGLQALAQGAPWPGARQGAGLGLSICRSLVRLMGGEIAIASEVGKGTTVEFRIPVLEVATPVPAWGKNRPRRLLGLLPGQAIYRLLVVDDQPEARQLLLRLLAPLGFELKEARDGREAIELWRQWRPHLIWMDMRMPGLGGREATRCIRAEAGECPPVIVALTASVFEEERGDVLAAGCDDFLRKPFAAADLYDLLTLHLGVRFIYEEAAPDLQPLDTAELAALPDSLRAPLAEALRRLDAAAVERAVAAIRVEHSRLAGNLAAWAGDFRYEQILSSMRCGDSAAGGEAAS